MAAAQWRPNLNEPRRPVYKAIAKALVDDIDSGKLPPGTRLPTHRELSRNLGVTPGTILRAYSVVTQYGLIDSTQGRGTYVKGLVNNRQEAPGLRSNNEPVDLRYYSSPTTAVATELASSLAALSQRGDLSRFQEYQHEGGLAVHREAAAIWLERFVGTHIDPDRIIICSGAHQGLNAILVGLSEIGDVIATEDLTYTGLKAITSDLRLQLLGLKTDQNGILPDAFASACQTHSVKILVCGPTLQNPTTISMDAERRNEIAKIAEHHGVTILELDPYSPLLEKPLPPLGTFVPANAYLITTMAKVLAPGLRVGFILVPHKTVGKIANALRAPAFMTPPLMAEIISLWIRDGTINRIIRATTNELDIRRKLVQQILGPIPGLPKCPCPHIWLKLPPPWRTEEFVNQVAAQGVAVYPGEAFAVGRDSAVNAVRIMLACGANRSVFENGIRIIGETLSNQPWSTYFVP